MGETEILTITTIIITTNNNWKMPSKNIKSKRPNAKCTLLAKPPKLTVMKPTDLWPNKSMTFSVNSTALKTATNGMIASVVWSKPSNMVQEPTMPVKPMLANHWETNALNCTLRKITNQFLNFYLFI